VPGEGRVEAGWRRLTSLKTRLRASIVALVAAVALTTSVINLYDAVDQRFDDVLEKAQSISEQVKDFIIGRVNQQSAARNLAPTTIEESISQWSELLADDDLLANLLVRAMASNRSVVEIQVTDPTGRIVASSAPSRRGQLAAKLPEFSRWRRDAGWRRLLDLFSDRHDYTVTALVGVKNQPVFYIRVLLAPVLLRESVMSQAGHLGWASAVILFAAVLISFIFSNISLRPLVRLGAEIDRIAEGVETPALAPREEAPEVQAVQSKLTILGERYRGAREDALLLRTNIEQLLEKLQDTVLLFDADLRLISAGHGIERLLGSSTDEIVGRRAEEIFSPQSESGKLILELLASRQSLEEQEQEVTLLDHTSRVLLRIEALEDRRGRPAGTLITLRDAESRSLLEVKLNLSTRLAAISRLTGGVAHEIKNPLNAIALHLEVLRAQLEGTDEAETASTEIAIISREIARLDRVVKTFLDFTRPVSLHMVNMSLADAVRDIGELVRPQAETRKVDVQVLNNGGRLLIWGDRDMLKQAILNVVLNAFDAMPNGGRLEIETRHTGDGCLLSICDEGVGIPEAVRDKIFSLYFSTKGSGSGIGLAMTFQVMQLHNGTIDFNSEPGRGTTFRLLFPAVERTESARNLR